MRRDPIVMVDHDPAWAAAFARQRDRVTPALAPALVRPVEHIGSTAVPGLAAKPIIDMLAVVEDIDAVDLLVDALGAVGWVAAPEPGDEAGRRRSFCTPSVERRTHHLHVVEARAEGWPGWLAFRDRLRTEPAVAAEYEALKRRLANEAGADPNDRAAYRDGKAPFIRSVTDAALGGTEVGS